MIYKMDCHCHPLSHVHYPEPAWRASLTAEDQKAIEEMIYLAIGRGLDAIAITDHNQFSSSWYAKRFVKEHPLLAIKVVTGAECSVIIDGTEIHVLALGCKDTFEFNENDDLDILIDKIHDTDGAAVLAHPFYYKYLVQSIQDYFDGIEEYNGVNACGSCSEPIYVPKNFDGFKTQGSDFHIGYGRTIRPEQLKAVTEVDENNWMLYNIIMES